MRWAEPVLAVRDLRRSLEFYERVLGLEVVRDFGSHAALTGGLALQSLESWAELLNKTPLRLSPEGSFFSEAAGIGLNIKFHQARVAF